MCKNTSPPRDGSPSTIKDSFTGKQRNVPSAKRVEANNILQPPSFMAKYSCLSFFVALFGIWAKYTFFEETATPTVHTPLHGYQVPLVFTTFYLVSLPLLKLAVEKYCTGRVDMKELLLPSMIFYNVAQVFVNCWMVYRFISAVLFEGHPFIGDMVSTKCVYVVWVHYTNKYLEFLDTYFMVLRGKMDQVSFLHVYHHFTISWAWWIGLSTCPFGDAYFGALLNSMIHVMMYSYYAMSLLKIPCPFKRYLTMAQLTQFATVVMYSFVCVMMWPSGQRDWKAYTAISTQVWEMVSLFALFSLFYKKSYGEKKNAKRDNTTTKVTQTTSDSSRTLSGLSKANKLVSAAVNSPPAQTVNKAANRPSWSIVQ